MTQENDTKDVDTFIYLFIIYLQLAILKRKIFGNIFCKIFYKKNSIKSKYYVKKVKFAFYSVILS